MPDVEKRPFDQIAGFSQLSDGSDNMQVDGAENPVS